jgi:Domain of unknown function (DUF1877)
MSMIGHVFAIPESQARLALRGDDSFFGLLKSRDAVTHVSLENAWHGLHYLLTGDPTEMSGPLAFIVAGGEEVPDSNSGYGPARIFLPTETAEINAALADVDDSALWSRFDAEAMTEQGVYPPFIWHEPEEDLKDKYLSYFNNLKQLVATAVTRGQALVIYLT